MRVVLLAVQSLDGFITRHREPGTAFASADDQSHFSRALKECDCSVMGGETYRVSRDLIRSRLTAQRLRMVMTRDPARLASDAAPGLLEFTDHGPAEIVKQLGARGRSRCALLGGGAVNQLFLEAELVDEVWVTIEPRIFGEGTPLLRGAADVKLTLRSVDHLSSQTLLLKYDVKL
ncbi:MAG TPA: dihydrofolate reductase family protein [Opitutaceae bacterium]|jgi:riboflavin biosynthesis pyrimidine reductase